MICTAFNGHSNSGAEHRKRPEKTLFGDSDKVITPPPPAKLKKMPLEPVAEPVLPPQKGWRAVVRITSGIALLLVGVVGLILPIMPGWVFIIPGLMILSDYFPPIKRLLDWAKTKYAAVKENKS